MAHSSHVPMTTNIGSVTSCGRVIRRLIIMGVSLGVFAFGWLGGYDAYWPPDSQREEPTAAVAIHAVVERIIGVESHGDPNAKNKRSSATGLGQFLDETWLDMIRAHRPDLGQGRSQDEILELRRDAKGLTLLVARELWRSCQQWRMPTPPSLWQPPTQRVEPSEKKSLRQIPSSNASLSLILGPGRTAKCVDV
jgi:hypothetical protein